MASPDLPDHQVRMARQGLRVAPDLQAPMAWTVPLDPQEREAALLDQPDLRDPQVQVAGRQDLRGHLVMMALREHKGQLDPQGRMALQGLQGHKVQPALQALMDWMVSLDLSAPLDREAALLDLPDQLDPQVQVAGRQDLRGHLV